MYSERDTFNHLKYGGNWFSSAHSCLDAFQKLKEKEVLWEFKVGKTNEYGLVEVWFNTLKDIYIRDVKISPLPNGRYHCIAVCPKYLKNLARSGGDFWKSICI